MHPMIAGHSETVLMAREMKLEEAQGELIGMGSGTIVSCLRGKLAFLKTKTNE